jgi:hypothetical protein
MNAVNLYEQVVLITQEYLGPAADRFVTRIIGAHFDKDPNQLKKKDIPQLSQWIKISLGLLTDNRKIVDECEEKIMQLA